jgi:hypothetical protein
MNAINTVIDFSQGSTADDMTFVSEPISGADLSVGSGFKAESFRAGDIGKAMDPLVMVDHYVCLRIVKVFFTIEIHWEMTSICNPGICTGSAPVVVRFMMNPLERMRVSTDYRYSSMYRRPYDSNHLLHSSYDQKICP